MFAAFQQSAAGTVFNNFLFNLPPGISTGSSAEEDATTLENGKRRQRTKTLSEGNFTKPPTKAMKTGGDGEQNPHSAFTFDPAMDWKNSCLPTFSNDFFSDPPAASASFTAPKFFSSFAQTGEDQLFSSDMCNFGGFELPTCFAFNNENEEMTSNPGTPGTKSDPEEFASAMHTPMESSSGLFEIKEQPHPQQRKSYKTESRYISPNPVIALKECYQNSGPENKKIVSGVVSVELVGNDGVSLSTMKTDILESASEDGIHQFLSPATISTSKFLLKVTQNSSGSLFRLKFFVTYIDEDKKTHQEIIISDPFAVRSNVRSRSGLSLNKST
eukprot:TRINITY_DN2377_c0_g1_i1.p1 TRINITY_DN2377_c0_g1~~TRINITY_DN2377_c0_g1_i1.p1  ORF type:complete len:329 (+),score=98.12 TRINITY_DN2377_c0_g1_i1:1731-2717(+)